MDVGSFDVGFITLNMDVAESKNSNWATAHVVQPIPRASDHNL